MDKEIKINQISCCKCGKPMGGMSCSYFPLPDTKTKYFCSEKCWGGGAVYELVSHAELEKEDAQKKKKGEK